MLQMTWLSQRLKVAIEHLKKTPTSIPRTFTNHCQIHKLELSTKGKVTSLKQPEIVSNSIQTKQPMLAELPKVYL